MKNYTPIFLKYGGRHIKPFCYAALMTSAAALTAQLTAQGAAAEEAAESEVLEEVVVTGSRIGRKDFASNSPITTLNADSIQATGAVTLEDALADLPQFGIGSVATTTGFFASGQATLNLRGLGPQRNLVLLDGRRMQPSNSEQVVDINMIPKAIIENVEVISGGASAVYGSDAIAGVVNFKTRKDFQGIQIDGQYNTSQDFGGATKDIAVTVGGNFAEDRGNAVLSVSYTDRDAIGTEEIDFFRDDPGQGDLRTGQGTYNPGTNGPSQAAIDTVFATYGVTPGAVPAGSFLSFNEDNTLFAATNGLANFMGGFGLRATGDQVTYTQVASLSQTPLERYTVFARGTYEITSSIEGYAQAQFSKMETNTQAEAGNTTLTIPVTNPFIPTDLQTLLASRADPNAPLLLEKRFFGIGPRKNQRTFEIFQIHVGLSGTLDVIDGSWDLYGSHGSTEVTTSSPNSVIRSSLNELLTAADGGASLCDGGYNPFGLSTVTDDCHSFMAATLFQRTTLTQDIVEGNIQGHVMDLPAGEVRFAAGVHYRSNEYEFSPDRDITNGTAVGVISAGASSGSTNVTEIYGELLIPLLADVTAIQNLDLNAAYRYSDYNLAGGVHTYKADINWMVNGAVRFRGGYQRAVRAPNVGELFVAPSSDFASIGEVANGAGDPCVVTNAQGDPQIEALCVAQGVPAGLIDTFTNAQNEIESTRVGNENLDPESADTYTLGVVFSSPFESPALSGLQLSVDYYKISIDDVIGVTTGGRVLDKCFNKDGSNPSLSPNDFNCSLLTRDPATGRLINVLEPNVNLAAYRTEGIDAQLDWVMDVAGTDGRIRLNAILSHLINFKVQTEEGAGFDDFTNTVGDSTRGRFGSLPKWKANASVRYETDAWGVGLRWKFINSMRALNTVTNPASTTPGVDAFSTFDLFGDWRINERFRINAGVNNLLNTDPPVVDGIPGNTEPSTYDILGRSFFIAGRVNF